MQILIILSYSTRICATHLYVYTGDLFQFFLYLKSAKNFIAATEGSALVLLLLGARALQDTVERFVKKVSIILYIRVLGSLRSVAENGTCTDLYKYCTRFEITLIIGGAS